MSRSADDRLAMRCSLARIWVVGFLVAGALTGLVVGMLATFWAMNLLEGLS